MFTLLAKINGRPYEAAFDTLAKAEKKRDLLVEMGVAWWLILEDDGTNTRELAGSELAAADG